MELPQQLVLKSDDPMERIIELALAMSCVNYVHESEDNQLTKGLDFYLPDLDLFIEVKQMHSNRIATQMSRVPNIIVAQGRPAVERLAEMIKKGGLL